MKQNNADINIGYETNSKRVTVDIEKPPKLKIIFPTRLAEKLRVNPSFFDQPIGRLRHAIKYSVDLNTNVHQLFVYTDIACYSFLGDVTATILRVIPCETKKDTNHIHKEFVNLHYVSVAKSFIDQVQETIKGDTGNDVPFISGKTLIKLHFRQRE